MSQIFPEATKVGRSGPETWTGAMDRDWWVARGPNGGYVAAIVLRALLGAVEDPARSPRSLTVHYVRPPAEGPVEIAARVERAGRSVSTASARLTQGDRLVGLALGAFSLPWEAKRDFADLAPPAADPPQVAQDFANRDDLPPIALRWDFAAPLGAPPFSGARAARSGGWLRLAEPQVADALVVAAMTDAWYPAVFPRLTAPAALPTIDLTIHFREPLPLEGARPEDWYLSAFWSRWGREGFVEEDGEVWSSDGRLLAQSRQLALMI